MTEERHSRRPAAVGRHKCLMAPVRLAAGVSRRRARDHRNEAFEGGTDTFVVPTHAGLEWCRFAQFDTSHSLGLSERGAASFGMSLADYGRRHAERAGDHPGPRAGAARARRRGGRARPPGRAVQALPEARDRPASDAPPHGPRRPRRGGDAQLPDRPGRDPRGPGRGRDRRPGGRRRAVSLGSRRARRLRPRRARPLLRRRPAVPAPRPARPRAHPASSSRS